jgi:hypothetical protein
MMNDFVISIGVSLLAVGVGLLWGWFVDPPEVK